MHPIPKRHLRGKVLNFSEGTLALQPDQVEATIADLCRRAAGVLAANKWRAIYLVPTGHPLLSIAAALLVFRITRLDPVIVSYFGEEGYRDIKLDLRRFIVGREER
jgi:hypothetical protein